MCIGYRTKTINVPVLESPSKNVSVTLLRVSSLCHYSRNSIVKLLCRQRFVGHSGTCEKGSEVCCYAVWLDHEWWCVFVAYYISSQELTYCQTYRP